MAEQATVGQRFIQLIAHLGISKNAFANSLDKTATVIQHLVEERNKPGFDLLCKVFEVYPNVSKDWLIQGAGPMLMSGVAAPATPFSGASVVAAPAETVGVAVPAVAPVATESVTESAAPVASVVASSLQQAPALVVKASVEEPATPVPVALAAATAPVAASVAAPAPAETPDTAWQTTLYTQQMAHQLAMAELRNQHLQDQQRLMQQMLDLMQRKL